MRKTLLCLIIVSAWFAFIGFNAHKAAADRTVTDVVPKSDGGAASRQNLDLEPNPSGSIIVDDPAPQGAKYRIKIRFKNRAWGCGCCEFWVCARNCHYAGCIRKGSRWKGVLKTNADCVWLGVEDWCGWVDTPCKRTRDLKKVKAINKVDVLKVKWVYE